MNAISKHLFFFTLKLNIFLKSGWCSELFFLLFFFGNFSEALIIYCSTEHGNPTDM